MMKILYGEIFFIKKNQMNEYDKSWCQKLLTELNKMPITVPFRLPVDPIRDSAPNYLKIVKQPMDLGTMKKKLAADEYHTVQSFIDDIKLICDNAKLFNGEKSYYGLICDDIMTEVHKFYCEKVNNTHQEWLKSLNKAVYELQEHMKYAPVDSSIIPKEVPMPNISSLDQDQILQIESKIGGDSINTLKKSWPFLNEATQKKIVQIVH